MRSTFQSTKSAATVVQLAACYFGVATLDLVGAELPKNDPPGKVSSEKGRTSSRSGNSTANKVVIPESKETSALKARFNNSTTFQKLTADDQKFVFELLPYIKNVESLFNLCNEMKYGQPALTAVYDDIPSILESFRSIQNESKLHFTSEIKGRVIDQLLHEIANWRLKVDQGNRGACHSTALYISLLRTKPAAAIDMVSQLLVRGEYSRGIFHLKPKFDCTTLFFSANFDGNPATLGEQLIGSALIFDREKDNENIVYSPDRDVFVNDKGVLMEAEGATNNSILGLINSFAFKEGVFSDQRQVTYRALGTSELDQVREFAANNKIISQRFFQRLFSRYGNLPLILQLNGDPNTGTIYQGSTHAVALVGVCKEGIKIINPHPDSKTREVTIPFDEALRLTESLISPAKLKELCPEVDNQALLEKVYWFCAGGLSVSLLYLFRTLRYNYRYAKAMRIKHSTKANEELKDTVN